MRALDVSFMFILVLNSFLLRPEVQDFRKEHLLKKCAPDTLKFPTLWCHGTII